jgi:hypothetical protein
MSLDMPMCVVMETLGHADFRLKRLREPLAIDLARVAREFGGKVAFSITDVGRRPPSGAVPCRRDSRA